MNTLHWRLACKITFLLFISFLFSQKGYLKSFNPDKLRFKTLTAERCTHAPVIDGNISEHAWDSSTNKVDEFFQIDPVELSAPGKQTEAMVCYNDEALYVFIKAYDNQPENIRKILVRGDSWFTGFGNNSDWVGISVDSRNDDYNGYFFGVNASGVKIDVAVTGDSKFDPKWDAIWDVAVVIDSSGWSAEFKFPFSIFQFDNKPDMKWGISFTRHIHSLQETVEWPGKSKSVRGSVIPLGILSNIKGIPNPNQLELIPYTLSGFSNGPKSLSGLDLRYGLTSSTLIKMSFNPDFGQVEADPSVLNLSAFETFYDEKRPFFSEGSEFFNQYLSIFNSRRIGKRPSYNIPDDVDLEGVADYTTILGATKVIGSLRNGINFGLISALTDEESATHIDSSSTENIIIEPQTSYLVGRTEIPAINKVSRFGIMVTDVKRRNNPGANVIGIDWNIGLMDNRLFSNGQIVRSHADGVLGNAFRFNLGYKDTKWWSARLWYGQSDTDFEINDLGFLSRNGVSYLGTRLELRQQEPWNRFINNNVELKYGQKWNEDNLTIERELGFEQWNLLSNYWSVNFFGKLFFPTFNDNDIFRDENAWVYKTEFWGYAGPRFRTDSRRKIVFESSFGRGYGKHRGHGYRTNIKLSIKPVESIILKVDAMEDKSPSHMQWVDLLEKSDDTIRVYANSLLLTRDLKFRLDWTFSPKISFQSFVQPFFAKMNYKEFYRLLAPKTMDLYPYDYVRDNDDPDFKILNTVGTFVFRWEYRPGSTVFLVYNLSQNRSYSAPEKQWSSDNSNAVYFKINYWLKN